MLQGAVLYVKSLGSMVRFYQSFGGEIVAQEAQDYVMLRQSNGTEIALLQIPDHIAQTIVITSPPQIRAETPIKLIFTVPSIDAALETAANLGGTVDPSATPWTFRDTLVQDAIDPEGNVYQLWQALPHRTTDTQ